MNFYGRDLFHAGELLIQPGLPPGTMRVWMPLGRKARSLDILKREGLGMKSDRPSFTMKKSIFLSAMLPTLAKPSKLMNQIQLTTVDQWMVFKFDDRLQARMEELLERKKADLLTPEEHIELESIGEMDRIFTHINAMLIAQT
jgi:hypothetical protein